MLFRDIYKVLIVAQPQGAETPMRRQGEAIVRHLIDTHKARVDIVRNTRDDPHPRLRAGDAGFDHGSRL